MSHRRPVLVSLCLLLAVAVPAAAAEPKSPAAPPAMTAEQQRMMQAWEKASTPGDAHKRLAEQFEGTWNTRQSMWMDPAMPPAVDTGRSINTAVFGGRQLRMDFQGAWMGQPFEG